ncbi:MAG: maltose acetyltransferase domain-containing protein [Eubacteriales bacterium]|nr:maltose acetyltransferase domain-containing protein [Eubacteriales bacterium]
MTEEQRIFEGKLFASEVDELVARKLKAHRLSQEFSNLYEEDAQARQEILEKLVESVGEGTFMLGPIRFHYGCHTRIGAHCFMNFNFTVQDDARVTIGDNCVIGAGSVVTRDIPANTFAAGAPARGFRPITEQDDVAKLFPELR